MHRASGRPMWSATKIIILSSVALPRSRSRAHCAALARGAGEVSGLPVMVRLVRPGAPAQVPRGQPPSRDRKSTRLNSSHTVISYAVFCLKKKKKHNTRKQKKEQHEKRL